MVRVKAALKQARLYLVLDRQVADYSRLDKILKAAVRGGVDIVQLRDKVGSDRDTISFLRSALKFLNGKVPLIINDRLDLAVICQTQGVHLGQEDIPIEEARRILDKQAIIGVSCQTLSQAKSAQNAGADYIGFGSVFKTMTKPSRLPMDLKRLNLATQKIKIPVFFIGGINQKNLPGLMKHGVKRVAVTRAISFADDVCRASRDFQRILGLRGLSL